MTKTIDLRPIKRLEGNLPGAHGLNRQLSYH